jgi:competence protein ComEC
MSLIRSASMRTLLWWLLLGSLPLSMQAAKPLTIYLVDVEGGQSTLFLTPNGQSLLIDTGWGYNAYRDANRIAAVARRAKLKKIDYVLITHYHADHVGGVPQLVSKVPVGTFIDHGPNREDTNATNHLVSEYQAAIAKSDHLLAKPGLHLPIKGIDATIVSADGDLITQPLTKAGEPNQFCSSTEQRKPDPSENARSIGTVLDFGALRIVDLGDLTWNKELELVCPNNRIGHADILIVSHHGMDLSNSPALVHALHPRVAFFDNGSKKGAAPQAWDTVKSAPGLQDIWQLHYADAGGKEHNASDPYLANVTEADTGFWVEITANQDGSFEVLNERNKFTKQYPKP